jgi:hypothetical protein
VQQALYPLVRAGAAPQQLHLPPDAREERYHLCCEQGVVAAPVAEPGGALRQSAGNPVIAQQRPGSLGPLDAAGPSGCPIVLLRPPDPPFERAAVRRDIEEPFQRRAQIPLVGLWDQLLSASFFIAASAPANRVLRWS